VLAVQGGSLVRFEVRTAIERMAMSVTIETVPAGRAVVREGDTADGMFVVHAGEFTVTGPGRGENRRIIP
jgi:CRP-like cAMP-binding protein